MFRSPAWLTASVLALALLPATSAAAPRRGAPRADSLYAQPFGGRASFRVLSAAARVGAIDSMALVQLDRVIARQEPDSLAVADALVSAVETRSVSGHARDPRLPGFVSRMLAIHGAHPGPDSLWLARSLEAAGEWHYRLRELDAADALLQHAYAIRSRVLPADDLDLALTLRALATVSVLRASGAREALARRACEIAGKHYGVDDPRMSAFFSVLAGEQNINGDRLAALRSLERVLKVNEAALGSEHPEVDRARYNVAIVAMLVGDYVRARALLERNVAFECARPEVDSVRVSMRLGAEVECLNELGDFEAALEASDREASYRGHLLSQTDPALAEETYQRSRALAGVGRHAEAVLGFDRVLERQIAIDSLASLPILFQRAEALRASADTARALRDLQRASRIATIASGRGPLFLDHALLWARCLDDAGRFTEAIPKIDEALVIADSAIGSRSPVHASLLLEKARALLGAGAPGAYEAALAGAALHCEHLRDGARGFPEREALLYAHRTGSGLDPLLTLADRGALDGPQRRAALERVIEARSLVLDEVAGRQKLARAARDARALALLDSLAAARATLSRRLVRDLAGIAQDSVRAAARADAERIERRFAALGFSLPAADPHEPLRRLEPGDVLVSFVEYAASGGGTRAERRLLAFVSRAGEDPEVVSLGAMADVDVRVARWRDAIATSAGTGAAGAAGARRQLEAGTALRTRVWDPLAPHLAGARRVLVVPDGSLQLVAFDALPARDGRFLVEHDALIARLGAERDVARPDADAADAGRLLAVGGPDFDAATAATTSPVASERGAGIECRDFRSARFGRLPGAAGEVDDVAARWRAAGREALLLSGAQADEATFKRVAPTCTSLHLATHGFFLGSDCAGTGAGVRGIGGMAPAAAAGDPSPSRASANPLRLAGLALAGANRRDEAATGDDGVLTAEEISALDLSHVNDVVLSACDSGVGDIAAGEGVLGLQRAFQTAGARSLVVSLWPVDDHAARAWMDAFYDARVGRGMSAPEAACAACRARLAALRAAGAPAPPSAWAGFVTLGR